MVAILFQPQCVNLLIPDGVLIDQVTVWYLGSLRLLPLMKVGLSNKPHGADFIEVLTVSIHLKFKWQMFCPQISARYEFRRNRSHHKW